MEFKPDLSKLCTFTDWEKAAMHNLDRGVFDYIQEAAGEELTSLENRSALDRCKLVPRVLRGIGDVDTSTELFGMKLPYPVILAPVGAQGLFRSEGEVATSEAATSLGIPMAVSTVSSRSLESSSPVDGKSGRLFQLYMFTDDDFNESLVKRAEDSGYGAIVITVDGPSIGRRPRSIRNGFSNKEYTTGNFSGSMPSGMVLKPDISWEDVDRVKRWTSLPVILKGIVNPLDAKEALDHDVDGIIVSNHGGRQLDGAVSSLSALKLVSEVTRGEVPLIMDGGIRSGSDVIKALCLGAKAVMVGRLYVYALSVAGSTGIVKALNDLFEDIRISMLNAGIPSVKEADESFISYQD